MPALVWRAKTAARASCVGPGGISNLVDVCPSRNHEQQPWRWGIARSITDLPLLDSEKKNFTLAAFNGRFLCLYNLGVSLKTQLNASQ
jgi:hypothetical protein